MSSTGDQSARLVAVVGATGRQGSAVVRHLLHDGWAVRALTRKPAGAAARELAGRGAEVREVDTEDVDSVRAALLGADGLFNVQNPMTSSLVAEVRQGHNVATAAADAGIGHVVYGAAGVGDEPTGVGSWDSKLEVARRFRELGLPLTVLRPMAFMELMTDPRFYPRLAVWSVMPHLMGSSRPVGWLCVDDLGAIAARVFADPQRWAGASLGLASDVRTIDECRADWRERRGRPPRGFPMPVWLFERFAGRDLTTMWRWLHEAELDISTRTATGILPEARTVRAWLAGTGRQQA